MRTNDGKYFPDVFKIPNFQELIGELYMCSIEYGLMFQFQYDDNESYWELRVVDLENPIDYNWSYSGKDVQQIFRMCIYNVRTHYDVIEDEGKVDD